ncbi:MAG: DEAD/DEAH box helicase [Planctomycetota bacterium]
MHPSTEPNGTSAPTGLNGPTTPIEPQAVHPTADTVGHSSGDHAATSDAHADTVHQAAEHHDEPHGRSRKHRRELTEEEMIVTLDENTKLATSFDELGLEPSTLDSIKAAGYTSPTPIQSLFIPRAKTGRDVMGQARTGTGKTAAFLLPIFEALKPGQGEGFAQAMILAPTRELAIQIHGEIAKIGSTLGFSSITLYGGASYEPQIEALKRGVDIVVGTPGRLMDHMKSHRLDLRGIKIAVLDEADRMLDLGFRKDIEYILKHCPKNRQTLLLSATIPDDIRKLARRFMDDPIEIWTSVENLSVDTIEQFYCAAERDQKLPTLLKLLEVENPALGIVFCGTKMGAKRLAEKLNRLYIPAKEIHGDLQQSRREKIMARFRSGQVTLLIATDVASRGIDVDDITHVFNWDIPYKIDDYVHRVGRTGRIGKSGRAFTFVSRDEGQYLTDIEMLINRQLIPLKFDDLTSKWWPVPPTTPPEGFEHEKEQYLSAEGEGGGSGGGGGGGRKKRTRSGSSSSSAKKDRPRSEKREPKAHAEHAAPKSGETTPVAASQTQSDQTTTQPASGGSDGGEKRQRSRGGPGRRTRISIVCARCGVESSVNFEPDPTRPIFCSPCHKIHKAEREKLAAEMAVSAGASHLHEIDPHTGHAGPVMSDAGIDQDAAGIPSHMDGGLGGADISLFD